MILKAITKEELSTLHNWYLNETEMYLFTCRNVQIESSFEKYAKRKLESYKNHSSVEFMAYDALTDNAIGKLSAFNWNERNKSVEIGYYLPREKRGKGFGYQMLLLLIDHLFSNYDLNKLYATTSANNLASIKILEKARFHLDGKNREHYLIGEEKYDQLVYSLLSREFSSAASSTH